MKKIWKWIVGLFLFVTAVFFASSARGRKQRAEAIQDREIKELSKTKNQNLAKAHKLGDKAEAKFGSGRIAKQKSEALIKKLEENDATSSLADRARKFNDGL